MENKIKDLLYSYVREFSNGRFIPIGDINKIALNIIELLEEIREQDYQTKLENERLKAQIETKNDLITMYETIISKSNFNVILGDKKSE